MCCRSTIEQKNSTSLPTDNTKAQDTGQQNNQGKNYAIRAQVIKKVSDTFKSHSTRYTSYLFKALIAPSLDLDAVILTDKKKPHIKKPLNAFMLYMKEMRAKVVAECTLKESAAINQILGRRVSKSLNFDIFFIKFSSKLFYIRVTNESQCLDVHSMFHYL